MQHGENVNQGVRKCFLRQEMNTVKHKTRNPKDAAITIKCVLCSTLCLLCAVPVAGALRLSRVRIAI